MKISVCCRGFYALIGVLFLTVQISPVLGSDEVSPFAIINGIPIDPTEYPSVRMIAWLQQLNDGRTAPALCTAEKIGKATYQTAAHCFLDTKTGGPRTGVSLIDYSGKTLIKRSLRKDRVFIHPDAVYKFKRLIGFLEDEDCAQMGRWIKSDLAVFEVDDPSDAQIPVLELANEPPLAGEDVTLVGFGSVSPDRTQDVFIKRKGENTIRSVDDGVIHIAGYAENQGDKRSLLGLGKKLQGTDAVAAHGDSGGPLLRGEKVIGVVSVDFRKCTKLNIANRAARAGYVDVTSADSRDFYDRARSLGFIIGK